MHYVNVTFNMVSIVVEPRAIAALDHALFAEYISGRGTTFVKDISPNAVGGTNFNGANRNAGDIIATMVGKRDNIALSRMSLTGSFIVPYYDAANNDVKGRLQHYTSAPYYRLVFNLDQQAQTLMFHKQNMNYGQSTVGIGFTPAAVGWYATKGAAGDFSMIHWPVNDPLGPFGVGGISAKVANGSQKFLPMDQAGINYSALRSF